MIAQLQTLMNERLNVSSSQIADFCRRWKIIEFALFGSVLRDEFRPDSDVDVLVTFAPNHGWSWFDWMNMQKELETMFGRKVDLISKKYLKNPYRRAEILSTHRVIYASEQLIKN